MPEGCSFGTPLSSRRAGLDAEAVKKAQLEQRIKRLVAALNMPEADERLAAAEALTRICPRAMQATPWLIKALRYKNHYVRRSVAVALGSIGEQAEPAVPFLIEALSDSEPTVQVFAAAALCGIGSGEDRVVSALIERLKTRELVVRFGLQRIFGVLGSDATDTLWNAIEILDHASGPSGVDSDAEAPVRLFLETVKSNRSHFVWRHSKQ